jgi:hypothetical protein
LFEPRKTSADCRGRSTPFPVKRIALAASGRVETAFALRLFGVNAYQSTLL